MPATAISETEFKEQVLESSVPVLVDFWAEWCGPCKRLTPIVDELADDFAGKVNVVKVNVDDNQGLATEYGVTSIPHVMIFKGGEIVDQQMGLVGKDVFAEKLNNIL